MIDVSPIATGKLNDFAPPVEVRESASPYEILVVSQRDWLPVEVSELTESEEWSRQTETTYSYVVGRLRGSLAGTLRFAERAYLRHEDNPTELVVIQMTGGPVRGFYYGEDQEWSVEFTAFDSIFALGDLKHAGEVSHTLPSVVTSDWL